MTTPEPAIVRAVAMPASLAMRVYFSSYHLHAADHFAKSAQTIEDRHQGGAPTFDIEHRCLVTSSIICSVSFLEAAINELYKDALDGHPGYLDPIPISDRKGLSTKWAKAGRNIGSVLDKYQVALDALGLSRFDSGRQPFQNAWLTISLRNELVHYQPATLNAEVAYLTQKRLGKKFPANKLMAGAGNPWYPDHCLGSGASRWAYSSSRAFADAFFKRIGVIPNYQRVTF